MKVDGFTTNVQFFGERCTHHIAIYRHTDHAMVAVQGVLLQVTPFAPCQLQGQNQLPRHCNAHPYLAFGGRLVHRCNTRPLVSVVCQCFRHLRGHRWANPRSTNTDNLIWLGPSVVYETPSCFRPSPSPLPLAPVPSAMRHDCRAVLQPATCTRLAPISDVSQPSCCAV